uniref:Uncharacterized protein n=1 Tax=Amphimedon queenslandica TaxID=400682 RepID=A0A1X7V5U7_AMPQE
MVPKSLVSESDAKEMFIAKSHITDTVESASPAAMFSAILTNMSQLDEDDDTDSSDNDDGQILYVQPVENTLNKHLETWVRKWYSYNFDITGNVALIEESKLMIHQMSRRDVTLIPKFSAFSAISVTIDEGVAREISCVR